MVFLFSSVCLVLLRCIFLVYFLSIFRAHAFCRTFLIPYIEY
jgi:hypothetical protein